MPPTGSRAGQDRSCPASFLLPAITPSAAHAAGGATVPSLPVTGVDTTVVRKKRMAQRSRFDDAAPYDGGVGIGFATYGCTSGFGVRNATTGAGYLLTAEHCGPVG
ncbi:MAG TPA: hypothetical protein VES42_26090 [Pilimelia sp.]|nr:hypothetical protein [Pilimelia sp.]